MRILGVVIAISLAAFLALSYYAGVLDKADVTLTDAGPFNLVYREHRGPYRGVRQAIFEVGRFLHDRRSPAPSRAFAIFYDDPRAKNQAQLRSIGGYITDSLIAGVATPLATQVFPKTLAVVGTFPLRSFMSPMTGPVKYYPKLAEIVLKKKLRLAGPVMEIYDAPARLITYIAPVR